MELAHAVLTYYFTHIYALSREKRFHLATRIYTWTGDERAAALLAACREWYVPPLVNNDILKAAFAEFAETANKNAQHIEALAARKPYFDRYPQIVGLEAELFRLRHLRELYHIEASEAFLQRHPLDELRDLEKRLLADAEALRMLSTWAVNVIYLLHRTVLKEDSGVDVAALYAAGADYDTTDPDQLRLLIYFYTHCIIADSNFYARELPFAALGTYRAMLARLETCIGAHLPETSLDTKLEFLLCCRLAEYNTALEPAIYDECSRSVSQEGTFLVDMHNIYVKNTAKQTFEMSEHRNVLFIMSALARNRG